MKKRIFSILLAAIMVFSLLPVTAFAEGVTIAVILPKDFPTKASTAWVCESDRNKVVYKDGDNLTIGSYGSGQSSIQESFDCPTTSNVDWDAAGFYSCETEGHGTIKFNMESDVLMSITLDGGDFDGTYSPVTIENILPKGFPTSDNGAWENSKKNNVCVYKKDETNLTFYDTNVAVSLSSLLTRADSGFTCTFEYAGEDNDPTIQFNMTGEYGAELKNIVVSHCTYDFVEGTYAQLVKLGNLEFQISQNDHIGEYGKSIEYENGYKLSVAYEGMGYNVISTVNEHTELRDIPDGTSVTFTLTVPQGETKVPDLMMSGAREKFTDNTFTTNLDFSQNNVTMVSLDFGNNPGPGQEDGHIVKIQINNNDGANGTIQYKFDTDEAFTSKTASDKDDSGNIRLEIPEGATTVTFKAVPDDGHALQDCTILYDDKDIDQAKAYMNAVKGDGYEYTLPDDDKTIVFRVDFGDELPTWNTVSWGGGNVEVKNGQVKAYAVHVGDRIYDESVVTADETNKRYPLSDITKADLQTYGVSYGGTDLFIAEGCADNISIDFRFIPDYGYQVTDVRATEESLLSQFAPGEEISTFHFVYEPETNVHFIVEFTATEDTIDSKGSEIINGASIGNGGNAIDSGNLKMTISDVDETSVSGGLKDEVGENEALYLDLALSQVVSKTGENGNWENKLTDLHDAINVTLNVSDLDPEAQYYIVREHKTTGGAEYETIPVEYNGAERTVSFDTDKFSTYALVKDVLLGAPSVRKVPHSGSCKQL